MSTYFVCELMGDDANAGTSADAPFATVQAAIDVKAADETILFRPYLLAYNKPHPCALPAGGWYSVRFVDAQLGTDAGGIQGLSPSSGAWATLQGGIDYGAIGQWCFCTGTETLTTTISPDGLATYVTGWQVFEGYSSTPRDGGYYNINGAAVAYGMQYPEADFGDGYLFANLNIYGQSAHAVLFGAGAARGALLWNVKADAAYNRYGFYSTSSSNSVVTLFCKATTARYGFNSLSANKWVAIGCVADACALQGFRAAGPMTILRSLAIESGTGFYCASAGSAVDSVAYNCTDGFDAVGLGVFLGCISISNSGNGFGFSAGARPILLNTDAYGNTSANYHASIWPPAGSRAVDPQLVNPASDDFRVKPTSPLFNGGVAGLHHLPDLAPVGHIVGPYTSRIVHIAASRQLGLLADRMAARG